jgi:hypothetical protein
MVELDRVVIVVALTASGLNSVRPRPGSR